MDGLDLQTARRFNRACKQRPSIPQSGAVHGAIDAQLFQLMPQLSIILHGPGTKTFEQTVLHLGCSGFGVGQAENMLRLDPLQQKPRHAIR